MRDWEKYSKRDSWEQYREGEELGSTGTGHAMMRRSKCTYLIEGF